MKVYAFSSFGMQLASSIANAQEIAEAKHADLVIVDSLREFVRRHQALERISCHSRILIFINGSEADRLEHWLHRMDAKCVRATKTCVQYLVTPLGESAIDLRQWLDAHGQNGKFAVLDNTGSQ